MPPPNIDGELNMICRICNDEINLIEPSGMEHPVDAPLEPEPDNDLCMDCEMLLEDVAYSHETLTAALEYLEDLDDE